MLLGFLIIPYVIEKPNISYSFYADDTLLYLSWDMRQNHDFERLDWLKSEAGVPD